MVIDTTYSRLHFDLQMAVTLYNCIWHHYYRH